MGLFDFFNVQSNTVDYNKLVIFYEEYVKSCTLQPMIFPQMACNMDVNNSNYVSDKNNYIAQFNRLIDVIRLGVIRDQYGYEKNITMAQEFYLRFTLATWIMSKLNSYDHFGQQMREAMFRGYNQLVYSINLNIISYGSWEADGYVQLYKSDYDAIEIDFKDILYIDEELFNSRDPFQIYTTFNDTPKLLLTEFYYLTRMLLFTTKPLIEIKTQPTRGEVYADFWLKKIIAAIIMSSEEWKYNIFEDYDNIKEIQNIKCYLWNDDYLVKKIQFKFDLKLINNKTISLDYEYSIPTDKLFNTEYITRLANFVTTNHNLDY